MKLNEIKTGMGYGSLTLTPKSSEQIADILFNLGIKDAIKDLHITLIYDRSNPITNFQVDKSAVYPAKIDGIKMLGEPGTKWYAIALTLIAPEIVVRHNAYINAGFKHSYPEFLPHLSLKYKPTEAEIDTIKANFDKFKTLDLEFSKETLAKIKED